MPLPNVAHQDEEVETHPASGQQKSGGKGASAGSGRKSDRSIFCPSSLEGEIHQHIHHQVVVILVSFWHG